MTMWRTSLLTSAALVAATWSMPLAAQPAQWPSQTVKIIVPVSPGSIADGFARMIAEKLVETWKQQVIVENRPGLPGAVAAAKAEPDGHTLFLNSNGHTIASAINKSLPYDPVKDFGGVTLIATVPLVMITPPTTPYKTVKDFIDAAKKQPGQLNFSSAGVSTTSYLSGEVFKQNAQINIVHVPYRGAPEAVTAVVRGDAQMYFAPIPSAQELGAANKVNVVAVNTAKRVPQLPNVPTVAEAGLPTFKYESWFGLMAPAATPKLILEKISQDVAKVLQNAELRQRMEKQGALPTSNKPSEFDAIIKNDTAANTKLLEAAGITPK